MSLPVKVYSSSGKYVAALRFFEEAAMIAALGDRVVKVNGRIVWKEGREEFSAGDSFDRAASVMRNRMMEHTDERLDRVRPRVHALAFDTRGGSHCGADEEISGDAFRVTCANCRRELRKRGLVA